MDNASTHKTEQVRRWFARRPRYHIHFTPTGSSWLNQVERFFAEITNKRIRRGVFRSVQALEAAMKSAAELLKNHQGSVQAIKALSRPDGYEDYINEVVEAEMAAFSALLETPETQMRIQQVLKGRK